MIKGSHFELLHILNPITIFVSSRVYATYSGEEDKKSGRPIPEQLSQALTFRLRGESKKSLHVTRHTGNPSDKSTWVEEKRRKRKSLFDDAASHASSATA